MSGLAPIALTAAPAIRRPGGNCMTIDVESLPFAEADERPIDARGLALAHMTEALHHLDSDATIPPIIGAHLQMAVDALHTHIHGVPAADMD